MFGVGMYRLGGITSYGEWNQNKLSSGIVHNRNKHYLFFGEFSDPKLSKAKGIKMHLSGKLESGEDSELVEEGSFKNDQLVPESKGVVNTQLSHKEKTN